MDALRRLFSTLIVARTTDSSSFEAFSANMVSQLHFSALGTDHKLCLLLDVIRVSSLSIDGFGSLQNTKRIKTRS